MDLHIKAKNIKTLEKTTLGSERKKIDKLDLIKKKNFALQKTVEKIKKPKTGQK